MKSFSLVGLCLLSLVLGLQTAVAGGRSDGGGNVLGGKMIESYLVDPTTLPEYSQETAPRLQILEGKNHGLAALVRYGIENLAWYFIPADLKELSQDVTGLPFGSTQIAIQNFVTKEAWIDADAYRGLQNDTERAKLLVHEALLARLGPLLPADRLPEFKKRVRMTVNLIFDPQLAKQSQESFANALRKAGWQGVTEDGDMYCELIYVDSDKPRRPLRCSEPPTH